MVKTKDYEAFFNKLGIKGENDKKCIVQYLETLAQIGLDFYNEKMNMKV